MSEQKKIFKPGLIIGILGLLAGISLLFTDSWMIGIFGGIASASLILSAFQDSKANKKIDNQN